MDKSGCGARERARASRRSASASWIALVSIAFVVLLWLIWNGEAVAAFKREAGPAAFFSAMALLPAAGFPLTPFFVLAGATFGAGPGLLGSAVALVLNLVLCYWIATSGLRPRLRSLLERYDYRLPDFENSSRKATRFVVMVKVTPGLPGFAKNYLLGIAGVPFWTYLVASLLFTGAYAVALTWLGESLVEHDLADLIVGGVAIALVLLVLWWWRSRREQKHPVASEI